jgi:hypothetical protein
MEDIRYLNVDLLIKSREDLSPIVEDFGEDVLVLTNVKVGDFFFAYFEVAESTGDPDEKINFFCELIEALSKENRKIWDNSFYRIFDIGYEGGNSNNSYSSDLRGGVIKRIAEANASVRITIYPYAPPPIENE